MEAIYAVDTNNGLSKDGAIPWKSKKDMSFFMNKTKHNIVIMGKNTYFSLPAGNRPLKNRFNIVLTSCTHLCEDNANANNVLFTADDTIYQDILANNAKYYEMHPYLHKDFKIFFIGGKTIYDQFIPLCQTIWVTQIKMDYNCDLFIDGNHLRGLNMRVIEEDDELQIMEYTRI
jgi:dihydrofolate reductase